VSARDDDQMDGAPAFWAALLLVGAFAMLTWCSTSYASANPHRRLPGKLPDAVQPPGYMWIGMLGIFCAIVGGVLAAGSVGGLMWVIASAVIVVGLAPAQVLHNRRRRI
jgi:hypothetical protein